MGRAMLARLREQGFEATGFDVVSALSECGSMAELCERADVVLLSLPSSAAVTQAVDEVVEFGRQGLLVIDTSTTDPSTATSAHEVLEQHGYTFLDAPVSGGRAGAEKGELTVLVGGDEPTLAAARPILDALTATVIHVGPVGSGQAAKLVNNLLVAIHLAAAREAIALGRAAGLESRTLIDAINRSSGRSAVTEINYPRWILDGAFDSGFSAALMRKDIEAARALAERLDVPLAVAETAGEIWRSQLDDQEDFNRIAEIEGK